MKPSAQLKSKRAPEGRVAPTRSRWLRRKCACGQHTIGGGKCDSCKKEKGSANLQRATRNSETQTRSSEMQTRNPEHETRNSFGVPSIVNEVLRSPGQPLDANTRAFFEPRFAHDFNHVRMHTDGPAAESARAVGALAYTVASDVVFADGNYAPQTSMGRELLAHELSHVMQQSSGTGSGLQRESNDDDHSKPLEKEAHETAKQVVEDPGESAKPADTKEAEKKNPGKKKEKKKTFPSCDREIYYESTCQFLVNKSKYICCDPDKGLTSTKKNPEDIEGAKCPSNKWTPIFSCDSKCKKALEKGCDDNDNWMAVPNGVYKCGDNLTICYNGKQTKAYVRDHSDIGKYEVSPGIKSRLGVTEKQSFWGAVYRPGAKQEAIDKDACCKSQT